MKFFKSVFRFYINSSIHVSLAVVSLTIFTCKQYHLLIDYRLLAFIFLSSITGYNFVKYAPVARLHHRSLTQQLRQIQIFSFVVFFGLFVCLFFINPKVILISLILAALTLLYAIPIGKKNLREIGLLKVFIIAFIWAVTTYVLPFITDSFLWQNTGELLNFEFIERMLWVVLLMIPFEIRDLKYDQTHLKTLVSSFGVWPVKLGSVILLLILWIQKLYAFNFEKFWVYSGVYLSLAVAILLAKSIQKPYYASFYVEALPIFWMILIGLQLKIF